MLEHINTNGTASQRRAHDGHDRRAQGSGRVVFLAGQNTPNLLEKDQIRYQAKMAELDAHDAMRRGSLRV